MNCEQAKALSIVDFLSRLGRQPIKPPTHEAWFLSPYRNERTASFHVHIGKNVWFDHGDDRGGSIVDLAIELLKTEGKPHTVSDALGLIASSEQGVPLLRIAHENAIIEDSASITLTRVHDIQHPALKNYLASRGIPLQAAMVHMKEVKVYSRKSQKHFFALAMKNEEDGYELRNQHFKGCLGTKDITVIRGADQSSHGLHVFEGAFDFETVLTWNKGNPLKYDAYILHSVSNLNKLPPYIKDYGYKIAYTWMDNDKAGRKAKDKLIEIFNTEDRLLHRPMNRLYRPHKDPNAWHMTKLGLSL